MLNQDGYALKWVKEQTPEICTEVVKQNNNASIYVKGSVLTVSSNPDNKYGKFAVMPMFD